MGDKDAYVSHKNAIIPDFWDMLHSKITIFSYSETASSSLHSQIVLMLRPQLRDHMIKDIR